MHFCLGKPCVYGDGKSPIVHIRIYGLLKIDRADTPLRPIVSIINSPTYILATYVPQLLPIFGSSKNIPDRQRYSSYTTEPMVLKGIKAYSVGS